MEKEFYISKEQFIALKEAWKRNQYHSAADMVIYNLLRSKSADNGFCQKTKNIQGNDEWYGFNSALSYAISFCSPVHKYEKSGILRRTSEWIEDKEPTLKRFKEKFDIDMPEDILDKLKEAKK